MKKVSKLDGIYFQYRSGKEYLPLSGSLSIDCKDSCKVTITAKNIPKGTSYAWWCSPGIVTQQKSLLSTSFRENQTCIFR